MTAGICSCHARVTHAQWRPAPRPDTRAAPGVATETPTAIDHDATAQGSSLSARATHSHTHWCLAPMQVPVPVPGPYLSACATSPSQCHCLSQCQVPTPMPVPRPCPNASTCPSARSSPQCQCHCHIPVPACPSSQPRQAVWVGMSSQHSATSTCTAAHATPWANCRVPSGPPHRQLTHALITHGCWGQHRATNMQHGQSCAAARNMPL